MCPSFGTWTNRRERVASSLKLLILNRDGVINEEPDEYVTSPSEWHAMPGSLEAITRANSAGFHVVVASNQPGLGQGRFDIDALSAIHQKLFRELSATGGHIDAIFLCPHTPLVKCRCRKPQPGMLLEIGARFHTDLRDVPVIGNSMRDVQAAKAAGAQPMLVRTGKWRQTKQQARELIDVSIYENLSTAVDALVSIY